MNCNQYFKILHGQIVELSQDYYGFHEQVWALPPGSKSTIYGSYKKIFNEHTLMKMFFRLVGEGYVSVYRYVDDKFIYESEFKNIIFEIDNWRPKEIEKNGSYAFSSNGKKYDKLVSFLENKIKK